MPDEVREALFPVSGIDVSCEVDRQTPRTTARGVNVRACDPRTLRVRGAARPGLTKLLGDTVSGLAGFPVQHLNVIVDPTVAALLASDPAAMSPPGAIPDPSTNNAAGGSTDPNDPLVRNPDRTIRPGGSGIQPNRHVPSSPSQIEYVTSAEDSFTTGGTESVVIADPPNVGDLIVVSVWTRDVGGNPTTPQVSGVTNNSGDPFANVGGSLYFAEGTFSPPSQPNSDVPVSLSMWYKVAAGAGDQTVKATVGGLCGLAIHIDVYRGTANLGPLTDKVKVEQVSGTNPCPFAGLDLNGTSPQLVAAAFVVNTIGEPDVSAPTGYTLRTQPSSGWTTFSGASGAVMDKRIASGVGPESAGAILTTNPPFTDVIGGYVGIAASFHR